MHQRQLSSSEEYPNEDEYPDEYPESDDPDLYNDVEDDDLLLHDEDFPSDGDGNILDEDFIHESRYDPHHHHHQHASAKPSHPATEASSATDYTSSSARPTSAIGSATISRTSTPAQFVFKKPEYNSHYHHTHFHHLEKKDTIFHDLKRFFKKNQDKKKKKHLLDDTSSVRSSGSSVYSRQSDLSFANEFNKNLEGRYGKWGELI